MSTICPIAGPPKGRSRLSRALRGLPFTAVFAAASLGVAAPAQAEVKLTSAFAAPIAGTEPRCTPEPAGRFIYGTQIPFKTGPNAGNDIEDNVQGGVGEEYPGAPGYRPANMRSRDTVVKKLDAGATSDLCFGFTLTPNLEPEMVIDAGNGNGYRIQDNPIIDGDDEATRVIDGGDHDDLKNATIDLPVGFAGAPDSIQTCSAAQFGEGNFKDTTCPAGSVVGSAFARVTVRIRAANGTYGSPLHAVVGGLANPITQPVTDANVNTLQIQDGGRVFNLAHDDDELARLGLLIRPVPGLAPVKLVVSLALNPDGSGRIQSVVKDAPNHAYTPGMVDATTGQLKPTALASSIYLESFGIRAWGSKAAHPTMAADFSEWGTNCTTPLSAAASIETQRGTKSSITTDPVTLTGCDALPFNPSIDVTTSEKKPAVPTGVDVKVGFEQTTSGPKSALLRNAEVTLPAGLEIGAQVASGPNGLPLCTAAQFSKDTLAPNACPAASAAGTVDIKTPLLAKGFAGKVYLGQQSAVGELPPLYLEASLNGSTAADAPRVKLVGAVKVSETGALTTTFTDAPQLRFSELLLKFPGGPNALFSTPRTCGTTTGNSSFVSWAKAEPVARTASLTIDQACDKPGFAPSFSMVPANAAVGASSPTKITISREDRSPWLQGVKVSLPSGFLADLKVATECSKADAAAATCPDSSRIASVTTVAGVGEQPLSLSGAMYLVERDEGAVAGAAIVVRAKIGELDLGNVVVPGRIDLRPSDAGLTLVTTAPLRFKGIALNLRSIVVDLDREAFPLNPTACGPLRATAELTGDGGEAAAPTSDVTYTGCGDLPFAPSFQASLSGDTKANGYPQVNVTMVPRAGDSNLRGARVVLPVGLATDTANLKNICPRDQFDAGTCADATKVGTVSAAVSITNDVIAGNVHLVRIEGSTLPGIGMVFTGRYSQRVLSSVKVDGGTGRLIADFAAIPDLPLRRLDMTIAGGPKAPIKVSPKACTADTAWDATLTGQGGKTHKVSIPVKCDAANKPEPKQTLTWSAKSGLKLVVTAPTGKKLKSAKLTLPKGFKFTSSKKNRSKYVKVAVSGGTKGKKRDKTKVTSTSVSLTGVTSPSKVTLTAKPKGYVLPKKYKKKLKKKTKLSIKSRVVLSDGTVVSKTLTVKTK